MKSVSLLLVSICITVTSFAQVTTTNCISVKLRELAECIIAQDNFAYPLNVTKNSAGSTTHIGFRLFSEASKADYPSPVYHFIERYLLELYLMDDPTLQLRMLTEDKVKIAFPSYANGTIREQIKRLLAIDTTNLSLSMSQDDAFYNVSLSDNQRTLLAMTFPVQYELLLGGNKKEIESTLYEELLSYKESAYRTDTSLTAKQGKLLVDMGNNVFRQVGMTYMIDSMNSDSFYRRLSNGTYEPIVDSKHPEESMHNLILLPNNRDVKVEITQMLYGYKKQTFDATLSKFLSYCKEEGCTTYVGIEEITTEKITGTIILHNQAYGYCHQLYFNSPLQLISNPKREKLHLTLYAYVPTHNIQTLFFEHINSKVKH